MNIFSKRKETGDRENGDKEWTSMDIDSKLNNGDAIRKNGDDRSASAVNTAATGNADDSTPRINPVKWTVSEIMLHSLERRILLNIKFFNDKNKNYLLTGGRSLRFYPRVTRMYRLR